jgi:hypothetical protein
MRLIALALALALSAASAALADSGPAFFPTPPPALKYNTFRGVLTDYAIGMKAGSIVVRPAHGLAVRFLIGASMSIDGRNVTCLAPPENGQSPPPDLCSDWPAAVKIGTTVVTVYYWWAPFQGVRRPITDKLVSQ